MVAEPGSQFFAQVKSRRLLLIEAAQKLRVILLGL